MNAIRGLEAWGANARIALSGQSEAQDYTAALRTLYSARGLGGKEAEVPLFNEILAGTTNIRKVEDGDYGAVTTLDESGHRLISLGKDSSDLIGTLGLGVVLSHEAYRDGIVSDEEAQRNETDQAVFRHMQTAMLLENTYGIGSLGGLLSEEAAILRNAYEKKDFTAVGDVMEGYHSNADFWKLVKDEDGNSYLEYDGHADIFDEEGNFLVGAGTSDIALQTALSKYLGKSMLDTAQLMEQAGMKYEGDTWINSKNEGKRIAIGGADDVTTTDYVFSAHHISGIQAQILNAFNASSSVAAAREALRSEWAVDDGNPSAVGERYSSLRNSLADFYLSSVSMFDASFEPAISTSAGASSADGSYLSNADGTVAVHKGIDIVGKKASDPILGEKWYSPFSGRVQSASSAVDTTYETEELWKVERDVYDEGTLEYFWFHQRTSDGVTGYYKDQWGGNSVTIQHGFTFGTSFLSMGFFTRSNHFDSLNVSTGDMVTNQFVAKVGNTGSSTGAHLDYNLYVPAYQQGLNFALKLFKLDLVKKHTDGMWYYDPENIYTQFQ